LLVRFLFVASLCFIFVSAGAAELWGLQTLRVLLFAGCTMALMAAAAVRAPHFGGGHRDLPMALIGLLVIAVLADIGHGFHPFDLKLLLPILVLLFAPNIAEALGDMDVARVFHRLLALYVVATAATLAIGGANVVARGYDAFVRYDLTGSLVIHASLCAVFVVMGFARAMEAERVERRLLRLVPVLLAGLMMLLTATRTALVTLALFAVFSLIAGPDRERRVRHMLLAGAAAIAVFATFTLAVSDAFFLRLVSSEQADYSSGRLHSQLEWLERSDGHPLGLGLGSVRRSLEAGPLHIEDGHRLEWPHNEYLRHFVEAGWPGLVLITLLTGGLLRRAILAARLEPDPVRRSLVLVIAADMVAQSLFQNYFNTIYHATVMIMLLGLLTLPQRVERRAGEATPWRETASSAAWSAGRPISGRSHPSTF